MSLVEVKRLWVRLISLDECWLEMVDRGDFESQAEVLECVLEDG